MNQHPIRYKTKNNISFVRANTNSVFFFGRALTNPIDRITFGDVFRFYQRNCFWICILNRICLLNRRCCCQTKYCIALIFYSVCDLSVSQWSLHRWHSVSRIANNNLVLIIRDGIRITDYSIRLWTRSVFPISIDKMHAIVWFYSNGNQSFISCYLFLCAIVSQIFNRNMVTARFTTPIGT